jgi:hypothetical protein
MTAIRTDRPGADKFATDKSGPERYAPDRRPVAERQADAERSAPLVPERLGDIDQAAANAAASAFEGEIREFVRRDVTAVRRPREENDAAIGGDPVSDNLNALIKRVSGASMEEIDRVILELQSVRDMLRKEGDRVSREVAGYASLSHAAMTAMTVIADSLTQWKGEPPKAPAASPAPQGGVRPNAGPRQTP